MMEGQHQRHADNNDTTPHSICLLGAIEEDNGCADNSAATCNDGYDNDNAIRVSSNASDCFGNIIKPLG